MQAGDAFAVTDNGRPVPIPADPWQAMIDSGQLIPAKRASGPLHLQSLDYGIDASAELAAMRALEGR